MKDMNIEMQIASLLKNINSRLDQNIREEFKDTGLTVPQINLIRILYDNGKLKLSDISKKMNLVNSTVSGIIDRLENQELLQRTRSKDDRRIVYIELTGKALELHKNLRRTVDNYFENLFTGSAPEEVDTILTGLKAFEKVLDKKM